MAAAITIIVAFIILCVAVKRFTGRHARRGYRKTRLIRGSIGYVRICDDCGRPVAECRYRVRQAEIARGMGQKR